MGCTSSTSTSLKHLFDYTIHQRLPGARIPLLHAHSLLPPSIYVSPRARRCKGAAGQGLPLRGRFLLLRRGRRRREPLDAWIGREVKSILREAAVHLLFILRVAAVPDGLSGDELLENPTTGAMEMELENDDELGVTANELEQEEQDDPHVFEHAGRRN
eukprot:6189078-Pleurochrysis_carterae.AAC.1